jgi:hypothetical protein
MVLLESRKMLQATLELCRIEGPSEQGKVVVTLETQRKMHIDRLKSSVIEQEVKQAVRDAAGREVTVEIRIGGADGSTTDTSGGTKTPAKPEAQPGDKAQAVLKKFGGRVVQVNPPDRIQKPASPEPEEEVINPGDSQE